MRQAETVKKYSEVVIARRDPSFHSGQAPQSQLRSYRLLRYARNDNIREFRSLKYLENISLLWPLISLLSIPFVTSAQSPDPAPVNTVLTNFLTSLTLVIQILILSALVVFGWGIVKLMFAASDPKKIEQAKYIILWGIIGIFALASMGGILAFIKTYLGIPNNSPIPPPMFTTFLNSLKA